MKARLVSWLARGGAWLLALAGFWGWTWLHLSEEWRFNPDYLFGFGVPFLAWHLVRRQLVGAQAPVPATGVARGRWRMLAHASLPFFLVGEILRIQDPTWRMVGWLFMLATTLATTGWLGMRGGGALVRRLAFPLAFTWVALPWPSAIEVGITQTLLGLVTRVTVDLVNSWGWVALQHGNLIQLPQGMVGVDRACSGIQSLQAVLVVGVFLSEHYRLRPWGRLGLMLMGVGLAVLLNLGRVLILVILMAEGSEATLESWHDGVGMIATVGLMSGLAFLAWRFWVREGRSELGESTSPTSAWALGGGAGGLGLAAGWVLILVGTHIWVTWRGTAEPAGPRWAMVKELPPVGWRIQPQPLDRASRNLLRFSQGEAWNVLLPDRTVAHVLHLYWEPGRTVPSMAFHHRPDVCLPSAGWKQTGPSRPVSFQVRGRELPGLWYPFKSGYASQYVFQAAYYSGEPDPGAGLSADGSRWERLALIWRDPGAKDHEVVAVYLTGPIHEAASHRRIQQILFNLLRPVSGGTW